MAGKVLVLGATGTVGENVVQELVGKGVCVRAATRDPFKHRPVPPHLEYVRLDLQDAATFKAALEGVERLFVMTPPGHAKADQLLAPFLDAALPRMRRVVTMTASGVEASDEIPLRKVEKTVERSGTSWTHLRPTWFMQNFHTFWKPTLDATGKIMVPAAEAKTAFVDARDIAEVAATVLATDSELHSKKVYTLTGPEALTYGQAAAILTRETGRTVGYLPVDDESFRAGLVNAGLPADYAGNMVMLFQHVRAGHAAKRTTDIHSVLAKDPRTLVDYARHYKERFAVK
ncbi:MAG: SDR family oxidoreductase [Myxococcales bacterium]